ncbi:hypothetical protein [Salmonirosea aquatica]|uniref:Uncharacterized protein n=1 Tax=Salmonirosea aquatica TaxID=2654236 RepID=A0A7C9FMQ1_9BACT|nr:hypothetical protein [Cytophagaceae bacterium SJW1-29]MPR37122.1 hypothetical protein [Cytophagaceae bacterium SJW1-29]
MKPNTILIAVFVFLVLRSRRTATLTGTGYPTAADFDALNKLVVHQAAVIKDLQEDSATLIERLNQSPFAI